MALLTIFQKVCDAVAFALAKGVIHRDLKPANIMVSDYGEVLLVDRGLAKGIGGTRSGASPTSNTDHGRAGAHPTEPIIATARDDQRDIFATLDGAVKAPARSR